MIQDHWDGHGLNELCLIETDTPGPGGASHRYTIRRTDLGEDAEPVAVIQFQRGPRDLPGSVPGIVEGALIAVLIDRLRSFQDGPFACRENAQAKTKLEQALDWLKHRADERARRNGAPAAMCLGRPALDPPGV